MADRIEKHEVQTRSIDHQTEALALLGDIRPPAGTSEAIASAQVHATLALAGVQSDIVRLLSMGTRELNASNMFKLAETLDKDHPLRTVIHNGLLSHMTQNGALHTDVTLSVRIKDLGLEVKAGDDIIVGDSDGTKNFELLAVDPDNDEWVLLSSDGSELAKAIDSPRIRALFDEDINTLTITLKESPGS